MDRVKRYPKGVWLALGVMAGVAVIALWPEGRLHAVATDRADGIIMATGPVDGDIEAVYVFDPRRGVLRATVLSTQTNQFDAVYERDITQDFHLLGTHRFIMVTGMADMKRSSGRFRPGDAVVYLYEATSGRMVAYYVPWSRAQNLPTSPVPQRLRLFPLASVDLN